MKTRFLKVIRDVTADYTKSLMLVLAVAIGVFGVGAILGAHGVLTREMSGNYVGTNPASATIEVEGGVSSSLLDSVRNFTGIQDAERQSSVSARMKVGEKWYPLLIFVIDNFDTRQMNRIPLQRGKSKPSAGEMLVERTALTVMNADVGDSIYVKLPHGIAKAIRITGTVHDAGLAPAWQEQSGYAYMSIETFNEVKPGHTFDQLKILVADHQNSRTRIEQKAEELSSWLEQNGHAVHEIQVPPPGRHPHQSQMTTVLSIFIVFSFLILTLGSILVATSVSTLMVKQIRQIGIMKTIGATSGMIAGLYLFMIVMVCVAALIISIPISRMAALAFCDQIAVLLNLEITDRSIPHWILLLQISSGIMIPILITLFPVIRGSLISVRKAMDNHGIKAGQHGNMQWIVRVPIQNEPLKLALRNVFRQRTRLLLTLGLLAAGGAMFMTALNVSDAWEENLGRIYVQRLYDVEIKLDERQNTDSIISIIRAIPKVKVIESWDYASTAFTERADHRISQTYPDKGHGSFTMLALPIHSTLLNPKVVEGTWLATAGKNYVVLNQSARALAPNVSVGDDVHLSIEGVVGTWRVAGFTEDVGAGATAYVLLPDFSAMLNSTRNAKMLRIACHDRDKDNVSYITYDVEKILERVNVPIASITPVWLLHNAVAAHMKVLINSLLIMAALMALVGSIGLMSTMSMNVLERTREIGVMRAIGATPNTIRKIIIFEGTMIGLISVLIAFGFSVILSTYMGVFIGNLAFRTPLSLVISAQGLFVWLGIILSGCFVATYFPAKKANRITTREALAYE